MQIYTQENMLNIFFNTALEREELILKKYDAYLDSIKDTEVKEIVKEFKKNSKEHINMLKDKMMKLNIQN